MPMEMRGIVAMLYGQWIRQQIARIGLSDFLVTAKLI